MCPFGLQRTDLTVLEVKQMPTEAKEWADSTSEFHDYAFFKVQQGARDSDLHPEVNRVRDAEV